MQYRRISVLYEDRQPVRAAIYGQLVYGLSRCGFECLLVGLEIHEQEVVTVKRITYQFRGGQPLLAQARERLSELPGILEVTLID